MALTGWLERRERDATAYPIEENRLLRRQFGGRLHPASWARPGHVTTGFGLRRSAQVACVDCGGDFLRPSLAAYSGVPADKSVLVATVEVAANRVSTMMAVLHPLLQSLRWTVRSRAALQLEVLALRHQLQVLQHKASARAPRTGVPVALGLAVPQVDRVANGARHRQA